MRLADEIQELFEEAMREVDRLSLNAVRAAAFGVGHWLAGLWPRMPCEGWQDELDWLLREYARNHLFITDQSRADIIAWVTAANEEAKRDALVPGSAGPRLVDICYGPRPQPAALRTAHDKPAPIDPDHPALRRVGHIIMEQFPPADWLKLAAGRLKRDPVREDIAQQFLAWIEAEQRSALGANVSLPPGGGVLAHNDNPDGAGNSSALDRAFPEPPFAQALGLPRVNNPPFGDTARRYNLPFSPAAGAAAGAAQVSVDSPPAAPIAGQMAFEIPAEVASGVPGGTVAIGVELTGAGSLRLDYAELASKLKAAGLSDAEQIAIRDALKEQVRAQGNTLFQAWTKQVLAQRAAAGHTMGTVNPTKTNVVLNAKAQLAVRAGRGLVLIGLAIDVYRVAAAPEGERLATVAGAGGGLAGGLAGAKIGAITFSWAGPAGVVVGGFVVGVAGSYLGERAVEEGIHRPPGPHVEPPLTIFGPYSPRGEPKIY